jgi:hypothetical protein
VVPQAVERFYSRPMRVIALEWPNETLLGFAISARFYGAYSDMPGITPTGDKSMGGQSSRRFSIVLTYCPAGNNLLLAASVSIESSRLTSNGPSSTIPSE